MVDIVATLGPSSHEGDTMGKMLDAGMTIARLNFSWGTHEEHCVLAATIRDEARRRGRTIPVIQDLSGPRARGEYGHSYDSSRLAITEKDKEDLALFPRLTPDWIALSFVGSGADVIELREFIATNIVGHAPRIIAKIERKEALEVLDEIINTTDAIMVARGDLGESIPFEQVPFVQKDIVARCIHANKPAIIATDMLTSLMERDSPSRADVSDIAHAVLDGASGVMLSNETAVGPRPVGSVDIMRAIIAEAQRHRTVTPTPLWQEATTHA